MFIFLVSTYIEEWSCVLNQMLLQQRKISYLFIRRLQIWSLLFLPLSQFNLRSYFSLDFTLSIFLYFCNSLCVFKISPFLFLSQPIFFPINKRLPLPLNLSPFLLSDSLFNYLRYFVHFLFQLKIQRYNLLIAISFHLFNLTRMLYF